MMATSFQNSLKLSTSDTTAANAPTTTNTSFVSGSRPPRFGSAANALGGADGGQNTYKSPLGGQGKKQGASGGGNGLNDSRVSRGSSAGGNAGHDSSNGKQTLLQMSNKRRLSHSPVSVNTTYELSEKNTQKLWNNFEDHIRQSLLNKRTKTPTDIKNNSQQNTWQITESNTPQRPLFCNTNDPILTSNSKAQMDNNKLLSAAMPVGSRKQLNQPPFGDDCQNNEDDNVHYSNRNFGVEQKENMYNRLGFSPSTGGKNGSATADKNRLMQGLSKISERVNQQQENLQQQQERLMMSGGSNFIQNSQDGGIYAQNRHIYATGTSNQHNLVLSPGSLNHYDYQNQHDASNQKQDAFQNSNFFSAEVATHYNPLLDSTATNQHQQNQNDNTNYYRDPRYNEFLKQQSYNGKSQQQMDFKEKVQQRIVDMQEEIRDASPERLKRHETAAQWAADSDNRRSSSNQKMRQSELKEYINQNQQQYFRGEGGILTQNPSNQSLHLSSSHQQFNKTTSRFNIQNQHNHAGGNSSNNFNNTGGTSRADVYRYSPYSMHKTMETFDEMANQDDYALQSYGKRRNSEEGTSNRKINGVSSRKNLQRSSGKKSNSQLGYANSLNQGANDGLYYNQQSNASPVRVFSADRNIGSASVNSTKKVQFYNQASLGGTGRLSGTNQRVSLSGMPPSCSGSKQQSHKTVKRGKTSTIKKSNSNNYNQQSASIFSGSNSSQHNSRGSFKISEQPYYQKDWGQASLSKNETNSGIGGSKNTGKKQFRISQAGKGIYRGESQDMVDTMNESIIQSQQKAGIIDGSYPTGDNCRRLMINMVSNLRHQKVAARNDSLTKQSNPYQQLNYSHTSHYGTKAASSANNTCYFGADDNYNYIENANNNSYLASPPQPASAGINRSSYNMLVQEKYLHQKPSPNSSLSLHGGSKKAINIRERIAQLQAEAVQEGEVDPIVANNKQVDYQTIITKLITCEKLLRQVSGNSGSASEQAQAELLLLRLYNAYLLVKTYQSQNDHARIVRYIEQNNQSNLNLKDQLEGLCRKHRLRKEISNYVQHVQFIYAIALILQSKFQKASQILAELSRVQNHWANNTYSTQALGPSLKNVHAKNEFGIDDGIQVRATLGECYLKCGNVNEAVLIFEQVKQEIKREVVFDKPLLFINVCNQLGNCYMKLDDQDRALDNFETSFQLIVKSNGLSESNGVGTGNGTAGQLEVSDLITAKICSNIAQISVNKGYLNDGVQMHERSLNYKLKVLPYLHPQIMDQYILLAGALQKVTEWAKSSVCLEKAYEISKNVYGEFHVESARILIQMAHTLQQNNQFAQSIQKFEHAGMVLNRLEASCDGQGVLLVGKTDTENGDEQQYNVRFNLNKLYLQLVQLYMLTSKVTEAQSVVNIIEQRVEKYYEDETSFKVLNELANVLRKNENIELAIDIYKKALLLLKKKHKNNYLELQETSKILLNIATSEFVRENHAESLKYYQHALQVVQTSGNSRPAGYGGGGGGSRYRVKNGDNSEAARIHMQIAHTYQCMGNLRDSSVNFNKAIQILEQRRDGPLENECESMIAEAKHSLRRLAQQTITQ